MNPAETTEWQNPFVDVFKQFNVLDASGHDRKGNVYILQDSLIGKRVFKIEGTNPMANYISFPPTKSTIQTLGLNGKYVYLELFPTEALFAIQLDFTVGGNEKVSFSLSNMYEEYKTLPNTLLIPFPTDIKKKWYILCLDIEHHMANYNIFSPEKFQNLSKIHALKSVNIYANLSCAGIFTSDNVYTAASLPREMAFRMPKKRWEDVYKFLYVPELPKEQPNSPKTSDANKEVQQKTKSPKKVRPLSKEKIKKTIKTSLSPSSKGSKKSQLTSPKSTGKRSDKVQTALEEPMRVSQNYHPSTKSVTSYVDQKVSMLSLQHVLGFTGRSCSDVRWSRDTEREQEVLYVSGKIVVAHNTETSEQRFFTGNTGSIIILELSKDGTRVVTAQQEREICLKVFQYRSGKCTGTIPVPLKEIRSLAISMNRKYVSVIGLNDLGIEFIIVWDLISLEVVNRAKMLVKQELELSTQAIKFSPIEEEKLISCGTENIKYLYPLLHLYSSIRFWRVKSKSMPNNSIAHNQVSRKTVFTTLDFDFNYENPATALKSENPKRLFVGSKHGALFVINYTTREIQGMYKIHDSAICSVSVSNGICATGSEDQYLRVWPLDFSEFYIEAKQDSAVASLEISHDNQKVVCGIPSGTVGILNLNSQRYTTLIRAHTDKIKRIEYHAASKHFITLSQDFSIRVWDSTKYEQVYEFNYTEGDPCLCIGSFPQGLFFVAGFQSGLVRIFDVEKTSLIQESRYHNSPVVWVHYSSDGKYLVTADQESVYNLFDVERSFEPIKTFQAETGNDNPIAIFTNDSATLATTGSYAVNINIWDLRHLFKRGKIALKGATIKDMKFSKDDKALFVLQNDGKIKKYGVKTNELTLLKDISAITKIVSNVLDCTSNSQYLITACEDTKIRVWNVNTDPGEPKLVFPQEGHLGPVKCVVLSSDDKIAITAGGDEGIYIWNFNGDIRPLMGIHENLQSFSTLLPGGISLGRAKSKKKERGTGELEQEGITYDEEEHKVLSSSRDERMHSSRNMRSSPMREITNRGGWEETVRFSPLRIGKDELHHHQKSAPLRKVYRLRKKERSRSPSPTRAGDPAGKRYVKSGLRREQNLPFKHYAMDRDSRMADYKNKDIIKHQNNMKMEYIIGYNNDAHCNIVWSQLGGWFAYGSENYVIIEKLISDRSQKIITLPDFVSCLALSNNNTYLAIGTATYNIDIYSDIHILDCTTFKVALRLRFHNKGIQALAFAPDNRHLISIGNYRDHKVVVWDFMSAHVVTSSYALAHINEIKIKPTKKNEPLEFITAGSEQVIKWVLNKEAQLERREIFIPQMATRPVEITAFDYVFKDEKEYILMGTDEGELILFDLDTEKPALRRQPCHGEVVDIVTNNNQMRVIITSLDSYIYTWDYDGEFKIDEEKNLHPNELKYPATCICFDKTLNEGLIGTMDGGILYANLKENLFPKLVGAPPVDNYIVKVKDLGPNMFVTLHVFGGMRIWSSSTGEELVDFSYGKITCKDVLLHHSRSEIYCFYDDNSCRVVDANNFSSIRSFNLEEFTVQPDGEPRYIADSSIIHEQGQLSPYYLSVTNKGELHVSDLKEQDEIVWVEVAEQIYKGNLADFKAHSKQKILNICFTDGTVLTYAFCRGDHTYPELSLMDQWNVTDIDMKEEEKEVTETVVGSKVQRRYRMSTVFTEVRGLYYVIANYITYIILRNSINRVVIRRISLESFPSSLYFDLQNRNVMVGLDNGWILSYNSKGKEVQRQRNYNDGSIVGMKEWKSEGEKKFVAIETKAITIYNQH